MTAIWSNLFHYVVIGPLAYCGATYYVNVVGGCLPWYYALPGVLATQSVGYAFGHYLMHIPALKWIHKFHHKFNSTTFVRPIAANSVSVTEFSFAYALPLVVGLLVFRPDATVSFWVSMIVSFFNFVIHTPPEVLNMNSLPNCFMTNTKHFYHHQVRETKHYAAPIFDVDRILGIDDGKDGAVKRD